MLITCTTCHARMSLEAALQDEAGRELCSTLAGMPRDTALPLMHYLGYFRPAKQQLGWGRSLRLVREVLALEGDAWRLQMGLNEAARSLDEKRAQGGWKPLGNHNYLKRCLESVVANAAATQARPGSTVEPFNELQLPTGQPPRMAPPKSGAGRALVSLEGMKL